MAAKHLFIANEIGLFARLAEGPATLVRLAELTGIARPRVRILADALGVLGLIECYSGQYQNSQVAAAFLSGKGPVDLRPFLRFWTHLSYPMWTRLEEAIRTGQGQGTLSPAFPGSTGDELTKQTSRLAALRDPTASSAPAPRHRRADPCP